jgi:hypothetical protein
MGRDVQHEVSRGVEESHRAPVLQAAIPEKIEYFVTINDGRKEISKDNRLSNSDFGFMRHPRGSILQAMSRHYRRS